MAEEKLEQEVLEDEGVEVEVEVKLKLQVKLS